MTTLHTRRGHRSLAEQDLAELGGPLSVLSRQRAAHVRLDERPTTSTAYPLTLGRHRTS